MPYPPSSVPARFLEGDPEAVAAVIRQVSREIAFGPLAPSRDEQADLGQECLRRLVESLREGRFDAGRDFTVYLQGLVRFTVLQELTRKIRARRHLVALEDERRAEDADPADAERTASVRERVARVLSRLSPECLGLVESYFFEDKSYETISAELGIPVGTVKSRLFRCLKAAARGNPSAPPKNQISGGTA